MTMTFWKTQQLPLSPEEVDGNFEDLDQRLQALEKAMGQAGTGLAHVRLEGRTLYFEGTGGVKFPPIQLPIITWQTKGPWKENTEYCPYDVVQHETSLYLCHQLHISTSSWEVSYWTEVFTLPSVSLSQVTQAPRKGMLALVGEESLKPAYFDGQNWRILQVE